MITIDHVRLMSAEYRAQSLLILDHYLRENITDEDIFAIWLEDGVPDGTEAAAELLDVTPEDFVEMWNLGERLANAQHMAHGE